MREGMIGMRYASDKKYCIFSNVNFKEGSRHAKFSIAGRICMVKYNQYALLKRPRTWNEYICKWRE